MKIWQRITGLLLIAAQLTIFSPVMVYADGTWRSEEEAEESARGKIGPEGGEVRLGSVGIDVPAGALEEEVEIKITKLREVEKTGGGLSNVTRGGGGYRFEPAGQKFLKAAVIRLPYDHRLHAREGWQENLKTYYYDTGRGKWEALELLGHDAQACVVLSATDHFTDMINGTLSLPENAGPIDVNINSIKGLEAADANALVGGLEGLDGGSDGSASFRIALALPAGRAGMTPNVAVAYSSGGAVGIMGRDFDIQAGGKITTDTRWGMPRFNGRELGTGDFERDSYLLDGVKLEEKSRTSDKVTYRPLREAKHELIERMIKDGDYWVVTDKNGVRRTYGRRADSFGGENGNKKYIWELEEERDVFGNTIRYEYDNTGGYLYINRIQYAGNGNAAAPYTVVFNYNDSNNSRNDARIDGRGSYVSRMESLLTGVSVMYGSFEVRAYKMEYRPNIFGAEQMVEFGLLRKDDKSKYLWSYKFEYEGFGGKLFEDAREWKGIENGIQVQQGVSSGGQGSVSTGAGVTFAAVPVDARLNGGYAYSSGSSETETTQTFIDINGDGRPDSVRMRGGRLEVLENTGGGFRPVAVSGDIPGSLGKEKSHNTTHSWNIGAGAGLYYVGAGATYVETSQDGSGEADIGYSDIDGDGLVDIIVSGEARYYRNVSGEGGVRFELTPIPIVGAVQLPRNSIISISEADKIKYDDAFAQEAPLREWRSPEKGTITVIQQAAALGELSADGIALRSYLHDEERAFETIRLNGANPAERREKRALYIDAEKSLYFLGDAGEDTRGDDIEWGVKIDYETIRYFGDMDRGMKYVPPESDEKSESQMEGYILKPLYDEEEVSVPDTERPGTNIKIKKYVLDKNRDWEAEFADADKAVKKAAWEEIVSLGWFVPGYLSAENFKALWNKAVSIDGAKKDKDNLSALIAYYRYHAGEDAYIRNDPYDGSKEETIKTLMSEVKADDSGYYAKISGYLWGAHGERKEVHPVPGNGADDTYHLEDGGEQITDRQRGRPGYIYGKDGGLRLVIDVADGEEWSVGLDYEIGLDIVEKSANGKAFVEVTRKPQGSGLREAPFYIDGVKQTKEAVIREREDGKTEIRLQFEDNGTLQYEKAYYFSGIYWVSKTLDAGDIEYLRLQSQGDMYTAAGVTWRGELGYGVLRPVLEFLEGSVDRETFFSAFLRIPPPPPASEQNPEGAAEEPTPDYTDEECKYRLREDLNEEEEAEVDRILSAYGRDIYLKNEFPGLFPYYESKDGVVWELKGQYKNEGITEKALEQIFLESKNLFNAYKKLIELSISNNFIHYGGGYTREIAYYAGGMHTVSGGGIQVPVLERGEDGKYGYVTKTITQRRVSWDSGEDYSNENRKPCSYTVTTEGTSQTVELRSGQGEKKEIVKIPVEPVNISVGPNRTEPLYGGINRWYYTIWLGNQSRDKNKFKGSRITEAMTEKIGDMGIGGEDDKEKAEKKQNEILDSGMNDIEEMMSGDSESKNEKPNVYYSPVMTVKDRLNGENNNILIDGESGEEVDGGILLGIISRMLEKEMSGGTLVTEEKKYFAYIDGSKIHTSRSGGMSYYEIPGIAPPSSTSSGGMAMPKIRLSANSGTDKAVNVSAELSDVEEETIKEQLVKTRDTEGLPSAGYNYSDNTAKSEVRQSVQSIGGNGMADILQVEGNNIKVVSAGRRGYEESYTIPIEINNISVNETKTITHGGSLGVGGVAVPNFRTNGKLASISVNGGGSEADGTNKQTAGFMDINGDGLPDYLNKGDIKMNLGRKNWQDGLGNFKIENLNEGSSKSIAISQGISAGTGGAGDTDTGNYTAAFNIGVGGNMNYSVSMMETDGMLIDMNGDGLPDIVSAAGKNEKGNRQFKIKYNLGHKFQEDGQVLIIPGWSNVSIISDFGIKTDSDITLGIFENVGIVDDILGKTGLSGIFGNGSARNPLGDEINDYLGKLETTSSINIGLSASANAGGNLSVILGPSGVRLNFTLGGGGGVNVGTSISGVSMRLMDMDGDGLPDRVLRVPGSSSVWVQRNLLGTVGMLKKITLPQGGEYSLKYEWLPGTHSMPQSRYVLASVEKYDGDSAGRGGEHRYVTEYVYDRGYYDRQHKEFFGFGMVSTKYPDFSIQTVEYHNSEYYSKGMEKNRGLRDEQGNLLSSSIQTIGASPYARVESSVERKYGGTGNSYIENKYEWEYENRYGNVMRYIESASGMERLQADLSYHIMENKYIVNRPSRIEVQDGTGTLRVREGSYDGNGSLTRLRQYYGRSSYLDWKYSYNAYGLITEAVDPAGVAVSYKYDEGHNQFIEEIRQTGARGGASYTSVIEWDKAFGVRKAETDPNGNSIMYGYDAYGRLSEVRTGYDGSAPAVKYGYYIGENGKRWYTVTENKISFSKDDSGVMLAVAELDGLGRVRRTAKSGAVYENNASSTGWNVSGAVEYDGKGRAVRAGQTYFVPSAPGAAGVPALTASGIRMHNVTHSEYDALDRVIKTTLPDGSISRTRYGVEALEGKMRHLVEQTDPLGNIAIRYSDAKGNVMRVERKDESRKLLTSADYVYNSMGEMLSALDSEGNPLTVEYDMMGRRLAMESADTGRAEWVYNGKGQLLEETNSELKNSGKKIIYEYDDFGRNVKIIYPYMQDVVYEYGQPSASSANKAGRLVKVTDGSGTMEYEYGMLGEVVREKRVLKQESGYLVNTKEAVMEYLGNYLGQMEKITYPDGEEVTYRYDYGGNVTGVTGRNMGATFNYVERIGYDEYGQRVYMKLGNGVETTYKYDDKRRWLSQIQTKSGNMVLQNINYAFDSVGNVEGYKNQSGTYNTEQNYSYDSLYQLTGVQGISKNYRFGVEDYTSRYEQQYRFDGKGLGNMMLKTSTIANSSGRVLGDNLDYQLDYEYSAGFVHRASRIGSRYYRYDLNGNLTAEQDGPFDDAAVTGSANVYTTDGGVNYTESAWGLGINGAGASAAVNRREYRWNERNQLSWSSDQRYSVKYTYDHSGERTGKYATSAGGGGDSETLYFNRMWNWRYDGLLSDRSGNNSKHVFLGDTRIATKVVSASGSTAAAETVRQYYYHSDHLGSAQLITDYRGEEYERLEYTPYGELWIEKAAAVSVLDIPYRFTGKERDEETGLYYYGARYLDPKTSRWLSGDPALGEYVPSAPVNDEAKKRNGSLPGQGGVFNYVNLHVYHYAGNNPVKLVDPDGKILKRFTSSHVMGDSRWSDKTVGNSSNIEANYMRKIGCAVTGLANAINTMKGTTHTPADINNREYFPKTGTDDDKSNINFGQVASENGLTHTPHYNNFKDIINGIIGDKNDNTILAHVQYSNENPNAKHYVGVNSLKTIDNVDYIEIAPTSDKDTDSNSRKSTWKFQDGKVYVPISDIKRIDVITSNQNEQAQQ